MKRRRAKKRSNIGRKEDEHRKRRKEQEYKERSKWKKNRGEMDGRRRGRRAK